MSEIKRPPLPLILIAHDLLTGLVVYWNAKEWQNDLQKAFVAMNNLQADALEASGKQDVARNKVIDMALVDVALTENLITPKHYREQIKTTGLTVKAY